MLFSNPRHGRRRPLNPGPSQPLRGPLRREPHRHQDPVRWVPSQTSPPSIPSRHILAPSLPFLRGCLRTEHLHKPAHHPSLFLQATLRPASLQFCLSNPKAQYQHRSSHEFRLHADHSDWSRNTFSPTAPPHRGDLLRPE